MHFGKQFLAAIFGSDRSFLQSAIQIPSQQAFHFIRYKVSSWTVKYLPLARFILLWFPDHFRPWNEFTLFIASANSE